MNSKFKSLLKNMSYTLSSNAITLVISVLLTLFVPKLLGTEEYAYWQLYIFYTSYVGFFHLGWIDGIYLKIGGENYEELDQRSLGTQFWLLNVLELVIGIGISLWALFFVQGEMKQIILIYTAICGVITIARTFLLFILQSTSRIQEYAKFTRYDRMFYFVLAMTYLILGGRNVQFLILLDIIARLIVLIMCGKSCQSLILPPFAKVKDVYPEIIDNIRIGSKLMLANVASMLIVGIIRLGIERQWNVTVFGKISLTLTISNLFLTFINAIGVVLFPLLRKTEHSKLVQFYDAVRQLLMAGLYGMLLFYYPARVILGAWLPKYTDALVYMAILFPMFIYESKMSLLINTYLKTLRKEKTILMVNVVSLAFSLVFTYLFAVKLHNLFLTVLAIIIVLAIRCNLAEMALSKELSLKIWQDIFLETILTVIFVFVSYFLPMKESIVIYFVSYLVYLAVKAKTLKGSLQSFKQIMKA